MRYRPKPLKESERYRGRRRVPTPSRGRYSVAVAAVIVSASIAAWASGAALDDIEAGRPGVEGVTQDEAWLRGLAAERPGRGDRPMHTSINQAPKDVWLLPLRGYRFTSPFGQRGERLHAGVDLAGIREGHPINAAHDGTVIVAGWQGGYGNAVFVQHEGGVVTVYGHNSRLYVKVGDRVRAGDVISGAGNTGRSYGVHLHFEIRVDGRPVNPVTFLKHRGIDVLLEIEAYG